MAMSDKSRAITRNLLLPILLHLAIVGAYSGIDPCNNNPGCMAGSPTIYFTILFTLPTLLILFIVNLFQAFSKRPDYRRYLKINIKISLLPFILVLIFYLGAQLLK